MDFKSIGIASIIGAFAGGGMSYMLLSSQLEAINERLALTPPVAVVDFATIAAQYPEGATEAEIEKLMVNTNDSILKLRDAGYIVFDASSVLKAPTDIYLNLAEMK